MKHIIDTLINAMFKLIPSDVLIYNAFFAEYKSHGLTEEDSTLFANISFLLTNKLIVDHMLKLLNEDVKKLWEEESNNFTSKLELHEPQEYLPFFGLTWPVPKRELASNHSQHLLSRVLLQMEQRHHINATYAKSAPIPTFLGVVTHEDATKILIKHKRLWNDEPRTSGIFFHGKMMHRIQFYMIMKAVGSGLLDIGQLKMTDIIKKLVTTKIDDYAPFYDNAWNFLLDFNISDIHFTEIDRRNLSVLSEHFPPDINGKAYDKPYLFCCDPYFLHSYLMTVSRINTPYLSECVTQTFCKSALGMQALESDLGIKEKHSGYIDNKLSNIPQTTPTKLTRKDLEMPNVLSRQAQTFATYGVHAVRFQHVVGKQKATGKKIDHKRSVDSSSTGLIQYRSIFTSGRSAEAIEASNQRSVKYRKM